MQGKQMMKDKLEAFRSLWKEDYLFSTVFASALTALINVAFTVYNGVLGILYHSAWNCSICVYYLLLSCVRAAVVYAQRGALKSEKATLSIRQRKVFFWTHLILLAMNLFLIVPIAVMVRGERSYSLGMIPAIAMAAYTTYRIIISIHHYRKSRRQKNLLLSELRMINLVNALVAVLTLQNALIMANGGQNGSMIKLTAWTSGGILFLIIVITIISFGNLRS